MKNNVQGEQKRSWARWATSLAVDTGYSAYQYAKGVLHNEKNHIEREEKQVKKTLSSTERGIADSVAGAVKGTVAAAVIYSGASWPVVGLISVGLLPKDTAMRLGKKILGSSFQGILELQRWGSHALSMMHGTVPTNWIQMGLKTGMDSVISIVDSEKLTHLYQQHHLGERIWLWTGTLGSIRSDLRMVPQEYQQTKVMEYRNKEVIGTVTDIYHCQKQWFIGDKCELKERSLIEQELLSNTVRTGTLKSEDNGQSWMPITYENISDTGSYRAEYENGIPVRESSTLHLPAPKFSKVLNDITQQSIQIPQSLIQHTARVLFPLCLAATVLRGGKSNQFITPLGALSIAIAMPLSEAFRFKDIFKDSGLFGNALKKLFSPGDYMIPRDTIEALLEKAGQMGKGITWEAGKELRLTVDKTGKELRATVKAATEDANQLVANFGEAGQLLIEKTGGEFRLSADEVLRKTLAGAEATLQLAGQEVRLTVVTIGEEARLTIKTAGIEAQVIVEAVGKELNGTIQKWGSTTNELVMNIGREGRLFITQAGDEVRLTADDILKKSFAGSELILKTAGLEARLTVQEAGIELRSVITHAGGVIRAISYEIPRLSRLAAESIAAAVAHEVKKIIFKETELSKLLYKMDAYVRDRAAAGRHIELEKLLGFVKMHNNLAPQDKATLYAKLIEYVDMPDFLDELQKVTLIIGATALNDPDLYENVVGWVWGPYIRNHTAPILKAVPTDLVRKILSSGDENLFLEHFGLLSALQNEPDGSIPIGAIIAFSEHTLPVEFVECDGREYRIADFQELYSVIGKRYGYRFVDDENEYFRVPDYRGYFLRGWDHGPGVNTDGQTIGSIQMDSTRMPQNVFQVDLAGMHFHQTEIAGDHEHSMQESGEHIHEVETAGSHVHGIGNHGDHVHEMTSDGLHSHGIDKSGNHIHTMAEAGDHSHTIFTAAHNAWGPKTGSSETYTQTSSGRHTHPIHSAGEHSHDMKQAGEHKHTLHTSGNHTHDMMESGDHIHKIVSSGKHNHIVQSGGSHQHQLTSSGEHSHTLSGGDKETRPKNINVKFMIKCRSSTQNLHQEIKELKQEVLKTRREVSEQYTSNRFLFFTQAGTTVAAAITAALVVRCCPRIHPHLP